MFEEFVEDEVLGVVAFVGEGGVGFLEVSDFFFEGCDGDWGDGGGGEAFDFTLDVPAGFAQVFYWGFGFEASTPDVFDGVAEIEVEVFGDLDALDSGRVGLVVGWMVY